MTDYNDHERRRHERDWEPDDRRQTRSSGFEESRHWREDDRRNPYDQARPASDRRGSAREDWDRPESRRRGGGWSGAQFGDWDAGGRGGGAVGSRLYGGYDRHGAGRGVSQSGYGGYDDYGYGQSAPRTQGMGGGQARTEPWRGDRDYEAQGYAPGAQIWTEDRGGYGYTRPWEDDHDPDYLHWREQQMRGFDDDYAAWRDERRRKFSSDFDTWRRSRPRTEARGPQVQADNPIVGDVSDGGTGDMSKKKN